MHLQLSARKVCLTLARCAVFLVVMHVLMQALKFGFGLHKIFGLVQIFNLDAELNLPTTFSFLLLIIISCILGTISLHAFANRQHLSTQWAGLSIIVFWFALDELLSFHEKWMPFRNGYLPEGHIFEHFWHVPYLIAILILAKFFISVGQALKPVHKWTLLAAVLYLSGVVACELWGGWYFAATGLKEKSLIYVSIITLEESLEMAGLIVFIYALLNYAQTEIKQVSFTE